MMPSQTQQQQQLAGNGPNTTNPNGGGMTTPNGGSGPGYKQNNNAAHSGDAGNNNVNNTASKKGKLSLRKFGDKILLHSFIAVVSVQRAEQTNVPQQQQQQQVAGGSQMVYPAPPVRYYQPEYMAQRMHIFVFVNYSVKLYIFSFEKYRRNSTIYAVTTNTILLSFLTHRVFFKQQELVLVHLRI